MIPKNTELKCDCGRVLARVRKDITGTVPLAQVGSYLNPELNGLVKVCPACGEAINLARKLLDASKAQRLEGLVFLPCPGCGRAMDWIEERRGGKLTHKSVFCSFCEKVELRVASGLGIRSIIELWSCDTPRVRVWR